jgi:hypothetical protein
MRLRISSNTGSAVSQLASVALLNLYAYQAQRIDVYREYEGTYMNHITKNRLSPVQTQLQGILNNTAPKDKVLYLYISAWAGKDPTHYVVLHKTETGLWGISCNRVLELTPGQLPKKDGVLLTWASSIPEVAAGMTPQVKRIFAGSANIQSLAADLSINDDLRWEMHLSYLTHSLFSSKTECTVWMQPTGKAVFRAHHFTPLSTTPYTSIPSFECLRTRPYAKNISKPRCIIHAAFEIPEEFFEDGLHIVPQVKNTTPVLFTAETQTLASVLDMGLCCRLFPYIGVADPETKRVTIYGLSYNPQTRHVETVVLAENRRCASIPLIQPMPGGLFRPNYILVDLLLHHIFHYETDDPQSIDTMSIRWQGLRTLIRAFSGVGATKKFPEVFAQWGVTLTDDQLKKLAIYSVRFP